MKRFAILVAMAATSSAESNMFQESKLGMMTDPVAKPVSLAEVDPQDPYGTTYDAEADNSWGANGENCDLSNLDKKWKRQVLGKAQQFTNPDVSKAQCL